LHKIKLQVTKTKHHSIMKKIILPLILIISLIFLSVNTFSQCTGTSISGSTNQTIPASTTYYVASANTKSGTISMGAATSTFCIDGIYSGGPVNFSSGAGIINNQGTISNSAGDWPAPGNGSGGTVNNNTGATMTIHKWSTSAGNYTLNNYGTLIINTDISGNGGTMNINNYGTLTVTGVINYSGADMHIHNYTSGTINVNGGTTNGITVSNGTFINDGLLNVTNGVYIVAANGFTNSSTGRINVGGSVTIVGAGIILGGTINITGGLINSGANLTILPNTYITSATWTNSGTINGPGSGSGCGVISTSTTTTNSGTLSGYTDICDATPPGGTIKIDNNTGTVSSTVTYCTCCVLNTPTISGTPTICSGKNTTLTASTGNGYSWSTGATTQAITVSPTSTTTYTVTITYANSCTKTATQTVTVNPGITCANAILLPLHNSITTFTANGNEMWFSFVADSSAVRIYLKSLTPKNIIKKLSMYSGANCSNLSLINSNNLPSADSSNLLVTLNLTINQTYMVKIGFSDSIDNSHCEPLTLFISNRSAINNNAACVSTCGNLISNGNFSNVMASVDPSDPFAFDNGVPCWLCGHGSPQIENISPFSSPNNAKMWHDGKSNLGEGIATSNYLAPLNPLKMYYLSYYAHLGSTQVGVSSLDNLYFIFTSSTTSGLTGYPQCCQIPGGEAPHILPDKQIVSHITNLSSHAWTKFTTCFQPSTGTNWNQLYIYPQQNSSSTVNTAWVHIDDIKLVVLNDAGPDKTINCSGNATIGIPCNINEPSITYTWSPSTGLSCTTCTNPVASPTVTTTYVLTVTGPTGCTATDAITVFVTPGPTVNAGTDVAVCLGSSTQLNATGSSGVTYAWLPATGLNNTTIANPIATPTVTTTYTVTVTAANGCTATSGVTVQISKPILTVTTTKAGCSNDINGTALVTATGSSPFTYSWSIGQTSQTVSGLNAGTYTLTVTDHGGCITTSAVTITSQNPCPTVEIQPVSEFEDCEIWINCSFFNAQPAGTKFWFDIWPVASGPNITTAPQYSEVCGTPYAIIKNNRDANASHLYPVPLTNPSEFAFVNEILPACNTGTFRLGFAELGDITNYASGDLIGFSPNFFLKGATYNVRFHMYVSNTIVDYNTCVTIGNNPNDCTNYRNSGSAVSKHNTNEKDKIGTEKPFTLASLFGDSYKRSSITTSDFSSALYPNPSNGTMQIDYTLDTPGQLLITDIMGKQVAEYKLDEGKHTFVITQNELSNGIYIYKVVSNSVIIKADRLVIIK
jgi:hypothetical protein